MKCGNAEWPFLPTAMSNRPFIEQLDVGQVWCEN